MSWVLSSVLRPESKVFSILGMLSNTELHTRGNMCSIIYRYSKKGRGILGPFVSQSFTVRRLGKYRWGLGILCPTKERSKSQSIQGWRPGILMTLLTKCWGTLCFQWGRGAQTHLSSILFLFPKFYMFWY